LRPILQIDIDFSLATMKFLWINVDFAFVRNKQKTITKTLFFGKQSVVHF